MASSTGGLTGRLLRASPPPSGFRQSLSRTLSSTNTPDFDSRRDHSSSSSSELVPGRPGEPDPCSLELYQRRHTMLLWGLRTMPSGESLPVFRCRKSNNGLGDLYPSHRVLTTRIVCEVLGVRMCLANGAGARGSGAERQAPVCPQQWGFECRGRILTGPLHQGLAVGPDLAVAYRRCATQTLDSVRPKP